MGMIGHTGFSIQLGGVSALMIAHSHCKEGFYIPRLTDMNPFFLDE